MVANNNRSYHLLKKGRKKSSGQVQYEWAAALIVELHNGSWRSFLFISLFPHLGGEFY